MKKIKQEKDMVPQRHLDLFEKMLISYIDTIANITLKVEFSQRGVLSE